MTPARLRLAHPDSARQQSRSPVPLPGRVRSRAGVIALVVADGLPGVLYLVPEVMCRADGLVLDLGGGVGGGGLD